MSATCGVIDLHGGHPPEELRLLAERMLEPIRHRGRLPEGIAATAGACFAARAIGALGGVGAVQPFTVASGSTLAVVDGNILNHRRLRSLLPQDETTAADGSVVPGLYMREGPDALHRLEGEFALAVYDGRARRGMLARDRQGVRPLFYALVDDLLLFGSELKALLRTGLIAGDLDYAAVDRYLSLGFSPGPATIIAGVHKVLRGERLILERGELRHDMYAPYPIPSPEPLRAHEHEERLRATLEDAVVRRLDTDVPPGVMLSGGVDSAVVVALTAQHAQAPIKTFTAGFADSDAGNELSAAADIARAFGTDHHEVELSISDALPLEEIVWQMDEPVADLSSVGLMALAHVAAEQVTVALSGQGADGLLGGLPAHRTARIAGLWDSLPSPVRRLGAVAGTRLPGRLGRAASIISSSDPVDRFLIPNANLVSPLRERLVRGPLAEVSGGNLRELVTERLGGLRSDPMSTFIYIDEQLAPDGVLHFNDLCAAAGPIELRFPFLDFQMIEASMSIPISLKITLPALERKHILRKVARELIPAEVLARPKVGFFNSAIDSWLNVHMSGAVSDHLLTPNPLYASFLDPLEVERLARAHAAGTPMSAPGLLLAILMLEVWLASALPRALAAPAPCREVVRVPA